MSKKNKIIMGSALGIAALAIAIDHTRHRVPDAEPAPQGAVIIEEEDGSSSPCSMSESPCSMSESPCSMTEAVVEEDSGSPCGLGD